MLYSTDMNSVNFGMEKSSRYCNYYYYYYGSKYA